MSILKIILMLVIGFICNISYANIQTDLNKAFAAMDFKSNITAPYQAQSVGFYSGGSLYARSQVRNQSIANINLPKVTAGCGGIDLHMGGFSFIDSRQIQVLAKEIMSNGLSYGFSLALETVTPLIANNFKDWRNVINSINNMNINSCEMATGLVGSVFPKTEESQRQVCQSASNTGIFKDYISARMECGNGKEREKAYSKLRQEPGYENQLLGSMNFAWKAIRSNPLFNSDDELSEVMMSLSGTVIYIEGNDKTGTQKKQLPSLATNADFINGLMHGGSIPIYKCDTTDSNGCLNPSLSGDKIIITAQNSFINMVRGKLESIVTKIRSIDQPLETSEIRFIQSTSLPIYKMLNVHSAFAKGLSVLDVTTYSEVIATDMLYQYLEESINQILYRAKTLQLPEEEYKDFISSIEAAKGALRNRKLDTYQARTLQIQMIEQTMQMEQRLASQLEQPFKDAMDWAQGLS